MLHNFSTNADEVINELFESLLNKFHIALEMSMRGSDFIFDCVKLLRYKCHESSLKRGASYKILLIG